MCIPFNSSWMYYFLLVLDITFKSYCIFLSTHLGYIFLSSSFFSFKVNLMLILILNLFIQDRYPHPQP